MINNNRPFVGMTKIDKACQDLSERKLLEREPGEPGEISAT